MKKTIAILLAFVMILGVCLVSCKGKDADTDVDQNQPDPDVGIPGSGEKPPSGSGGLQVGEDPGESKWGDFVPYP